MLISADIAFPFCGPLPRWVLRHAQKACWFDLLVNTRQLFGSCQPSGVIPAQRLRRCRCATPSVVAARRLRRCLCLWRSLAEVRSLRLRGRVGVGVMRALADVAYPHPALRADLPRKRERLDATTFADSASPADAWNPVAEQPVFFPNGRSGRRATGSGCRKSRSSDLYRSLHRRRAVSHRRGCCGRHHGRDRRRR
jgi:hypothetical protein